MNTNNWKPFINVKKKEIRLATQVKQGKLPKER